jgi:cyclohexa-1,5-dienecarbonyl-CoA hydratase
METSTVRLEQRPGVARIVLDRPPLNVLDISMLNDLHQVVHEIASDASVKVVAVTGEGRAFSAGVDVSDHTDERVPEMIRAFHGALEALAALEAPTVALVNGAALGGGFEVALACDMIIAREGAKLGLPEVKVGAFPPFAAAVLPRLVGRQLALDLILSGRVLRAEEGRDLGLVAHVHPPDLFEERADGYVEELAGLSAPVLRLAKRSVAGGLEGSLHDALRGAERLYLDELMSLSDAHEGVAAFMEKREPIWRDA